ncbi:MAG: hypothetical protein E6G67_02595 [Actinobacteria bacterium]|nr:MAG: hypothetical protein E6G67_02595 [Actinomycetota bacterium]
MTSRQERLAKNEALFREVNERVKDVAAAAEGDLIDFICECGDDDCTQVVALTQTEYEKVRADPRQFVVIPGHELPDVEDVAGQADRYLIVRKHSEEAAVAERTDPRA